MFRRRPRHTTAMLKVIVFNSAVIYAALILFMRVMGKRQLGELEPSELIVTVLISEAAATPITSPEKPLWYGLVPVVVLFTLELILSLGMAKSVKIRQLLAGKPALLIVHGRIDQTQMRRNRFTPDELAEALRSQGALDLNEVEYAILETDGKLNVVFTPENRPVTAGQMGLSPQDTGYPLIVINEGRVLSQNLRILGKDEKWLEKELRKNKLASPKDVYLMTVDMAGGVFLSPRKGR